MKYLALSALLIACPAAAAPAQITDTSFRDAAGNRVQQLEVTVDAPVASVWDAFTTDAGFESWAAPFAHITLGNDGMIEASYLTTARQGDPDNIRNRIVAYLPQRLLVLHNEHVPPKGPFKQDVIDKIRTVIQFEDLGGGRTRVVESGVGYGEGPDFDAMYGHFRDGNAQEFALLAQRFAAGPVDWTRADDAAQASVRKPAK